MMTTHEILIPWLFATGALRAAPPDQPFWYTSGAFGPYYINTHFLFGSEDSAKFLLKSIDSLSLEPLRLADHLAIQIEDQFTSNTIYHDLCSLITEKLAGLACDAVSGGERRDFFFSVQAARLLGKPHVWIMKNGKAVFSTKSFNSHVELGPDDLKSFKIIHVADLVTEASSYMRTWLPTLRHLGASMPQTLAVVDRMQGGRSNLTAAGTELISLVEITPDLFDRAETEHLISQEQNQQMQRFILDPDAYMKRFLFDHPEFLAEQLALGGKNGERAKLCLERGFGNVG